jgi:lipopolysaccharide transport system ATP-binding protein
MQPIIQVKNVGKKYDIRHYQGKYIALRDVLMNVVKSPFKFLKEKAKTVTRIGTHEAFWALNDINFDIMPGEVVGIIGRNGAGKSTLLKILTGITPPTTGEITMRGRVASLLEVGTGFHPELTGRENIFLNGAILGMPRKEIARNFEKIVEFAGIEKFLDTPVKYYSSGMYVRLAFSVAAHLEPDILLVDEVLAVGDAEFQKKCLGKMEEVTSKQGRTILFVSHNMAAIQRLCPKTILIEKGKVKMIGKTEDVVNYYLDSTNSGKMNMTWDSEKRPGDTVASLKSVKVVDEKGLPMPTVFSNKKLGIEVVYNILKPDTAPIPNIHIYTQRGEEAFMSHAVSSENLGKIGEHRAIMWIPANLLNEGIYTATIVLSTMVPLTLHFNVPEAIVFNVVQDIMSAEKFDLNQKVPGVVRPILNWQNTWQKSS